MNGFSINTAVLLDVLAKQTPSLTYDLKFVEFHKRVKGVK
ncbi:hypothetical protein CKA32_006898 [Geitlerinema sp. FC II]|nr:hypothetical protein CKA32_006898 [Geitlerinema sp. FC II]